MGIPSIEPWRKNAIQANRDFIENRQKLLLREALIPGGGTPAELAQILSKTLLNLQSFKKPQSVLAKGLGRKIQWWDDDC